MAGWRLDPQFMAAWMDAAARDPILPGQIAQTRFSFGLDQDGVGPVFTIADGHVKRDGGTQPDFTLSAPAAIWARYLEPVPPRHHHNLFAMRARVPEFAIQGEELRFVQHCHIVRRLLTARQEPDATVAAVLSGRGIWEFGRFAGRYRQHFGELPSETLERARR